MFQFENKIFPRPQTPYQRFVATTQPGAEVEQIYNCQPGQCRDQTRVKSSRSVRSIIPISRQPSRFSIKISIFMNIFSVHSNLIPIGGVIQQCWYYPGKFFNAALDKASDKNERNAIWIKTDSGEDIVSVQIAGLIARRILSYVKPGDTVATGQRYGFIRFGSRVDLYLPAGTRLAIKLGQWVRSGNDVIGFTGATVGGGPEAND